MRLRDRQWKLAREARMVGYAEVASRILLKPTGVRSIASVEEIWARGVSICSSGNQWIRTPTKRLHLSVEARRAVGVAQAGGLLLCTRGRPLRLSSSTVCPIVALVTPAGLA